MNKKLVSLLCFAVSAMAQDWETGPVGPDGWRAPVLWKASFSFLIIWGSGSLFLFIWILKKFFNPTPVSSRGPYIMLGVTTLASVGYNAVLAALRRDIELAIITSNQISSVISFLYAVQVSFLPAAALYLIHKRGNALRAAVGDTATPTACKTWKQVLDWFLVGATFSTRMALMAINAVVFRLQETSFHRSYWGRYDGVRSGLGYTATALEILLVLDLLISLIVQSAQPRRARMNDLVIRRLIMVSAPFLAIYAIESLIFTIYGETTGPGYDPLALDLAIVVLDGLCRFVITTGLVMAMSLPAPQWMGPALTYHNGASKEGLPHDSESGTDEHLLEKSYAG